MAPLIPIASHGFINFVKSLGFKNIVLNLVTC
jgi:hypothetical protein